MQILTKYKISAYSSYKLNETLKHKKQLYAGADFWTMGFTELEHLPTCAWNLWYTKIGTWLIIDNLNMTLVFQNLMTKYLFLFKY